MDFLVHGRQTGKTTKLLAMMAQEPDMVMICQNSMTAELHAQTFFDRYGPGIATKGYKNRFISMRQAVNSELMRGIRDRPAVIDDLELCLGNIFSRTFNVEAVSATGNLVK